jgi:hypothetical protein
MTKPAITKRSVKGAALTYSELDTNFENLKDATITLTAGTGGTAVTADLNGTITLVAGTGVTLTGDNTAKTVTIDASTNNDLNTNEIEVGDGVAGGVTIKNSINNNAVYLIGQDSSGTAQSFVGVFAAGGIQVNAQGQLSVTVGNGLNFNTYGNPAVILSTPTSSGNYTKGFQFDAQYLRLPRATTTQRNSLTPATGMLIFNTTTNKFQGYTDSAWVDLH